jgi:RNA polymerase-binding transcription factor DksA
MRGTRKSKQTGEGEGPKKMEAKELREFQTLLLIRKKALLGDQKGLEDEARRKGGDAGEISSLPVHLADLATDTFEQDISFERVENVTLEIKEIDQALERIREKTFGICETCEASIPLERLRAIPYTRLCLACKRREEGLGEVA